MMTEATLQRGLLKTLRKAFPGFVIFKHSEVIGTGVPDISVNGRGLTVWLEVKVARPKINAKGLQVEMMRRLARNCRVYYVVYHQFNLGELTDDRETLIVHPAFINLSPSTFCTGANEVLARGSGFDHGVVINFLGSLYSGDHER